MVRRRRLLVLILFQAFFRDILDLLAADRVGKGIVFSFLFCQKNSLVRFAVIECSLCQMCEDGDNEIVAGSQQRFDLGLPVLEGALSQ